MAQTLDVAKVMILLQRRYNFICEIRKITKDLEDALARNDEVSTGMVLQMRADEMAKADDCTDEIWNLAGTDKEAQMKLRLLMVSDPQEMVGESAEEKKIYEIWRKTREIIEELRTVDKRLSRKLTGERSYYGTKNR